MIKLVFRSILHNWGLTMFFIVGFVLLFTTLPIALVSIKETLVKMEDDITKHARGSYDILVRPKDARSEIEKKWGVVEENYLSTGNGGISIGEWQDIKEMSEIEVAAPVASLGYFTGESLSFSTWMPKQSVRVRSELYTFDGIRKYQLDKEHESVGIMIEQEGIPQRVPEFDYFSKNNAMFEQWQAPTFMLPSTFHLLVGIDPESEEELTGIPFDKLQENENIDQSLVVLAGNAPIIPVMKLTDPFIPVEAKLTWEELDIRKEQTAQWKKELGLGEQDPLIFAEEEKYKGLFEELIKYPNTSLSEYEVDFKKAIKPFQYEPFSISEDLTIQPNDRGFFGSFSSIAKFYKSDPINYNVQGKENQLTVAQIDEYHGIPVYRKVEEKGGTALDFGYNLPFVLNPNGEYSVKKVKASLSSSPLGLYQLAPINLIKDADGNTLEKPVELYHTIYPGSFVPSPAHGVINVLNSEIIKGGKPIDAIRIRVKGITEYNAEAKEKIERIAEVLLEKKYEVDIVAGSSYQDLPVYVEGVGTVSQPWTTLGAAATIINGWSGTTALLSFIFSLTAIIYLWNRLYFFRIRKGNEVRLLLQFGWETSKIKRLIIAELCMIIVAAWILSAIGLILFSIHTSISDIDRLFQWNAVFACSGLLFIAIYLKWGRGLSSNIKSENGTMSKKLKPNSNPSSIHKLAIYSIQFYKTYIRSTFVQVILIAAASIFIFLALKETVEQTSTTMLGEYVNFRVTSIHYMILGSAYVLTLFSLIESLYSLLAVRRNEISTLQSLGWQHAHIFRLWLRELSAWTIFAVMIGHLIGITFYLINYPFEFQIVKAILISMILFFICIVIIGAVVLHQFLNKKLLK